MSDRNYGDPVEDPTTSTESTSLDDAVASANDSLAVAEAASRDAVTTDADASGSGEAPLAADETAAKDAPAASDAPAEPGAPVAHDAADAPAVQDAPAADEPAAMSAADWDAAYGDAPASDASAAHTATAAAPITSEPVAEETAVVAPAAAVVTPSEPVTAQATAVDAAAFTGAAAAGGAAAYGSPQPIFVQAPEPPRPRGNRAAAGAIGLLAALSFALLYFGAALGLAAFDGEVDTASIGTWSLDAAMSWWFWVPVVVFFIGFWVLGAIINRGRWGHWVIFGLLVGVVAYAGHILGQLAEAPFWTLTASQGAELVTEQSLAPLAIAAFIFGRELTIWFGAWVASRGKRVTEINYEAQREYERTLEAGPQLHQL